MACALIVLLLVTTQENRSLPCKLSTLPMEGTEKVDLGYAKKCIPIGLQSEIKTGLISKAEQFMQ